MLEETLRKALRFVFGSGTDISHANPLPVTSTAQAIDSGTATGGSDTQLVDTAKDWEVNMHEDAILEVAIGVIEYHRTITVNANDTLTFNALPGGVVVAAGDAYTIRRVVNPLSPLARDEMHNVAIAGGVAPILAADIAPLNTPCLFRVAVGFDTAGVFSVTIIRALDTQVQQLNHGVVLTANCLFMFDVLVAAGDTINYRYSVAAQLQTLRLQEIVAATQ